MNPNDVPMICFGLGVLLFAIALYRFCTYDRADADFVNDFNRWRNDPANAQAIQDYHAQQEARLAAEDNNPKMIITGGRMTRVIEREDK